MPTAVGVFRYGGARVSTRAQWRPSIAARHPALPIMPSEMRVSDTIFPFRAALNQVPDLMAGDALLSDQI